VKQRAAARNMAQRCVALPLSAAAHCCVLLRCNLTPQQNCWGSNVQRAVGWASARSSAQQAGQQRALRRHATARASSAQRAVRSAQQRAAACSSCALLPSLLRAARCALLRAAARCCTLQLSGTIGTRALSFWADASPLFQIDNGPRLLLSGSEAEE